MNSKNWSPIRRVAEMLHAGSRNILTFQWTPELADGKADAAIAEMERQGVVMTTLSGVHPTAAFPGWLVDLRQREDQPEPVPQAEAPTSDGSSERADIVKSLAHQATRVRKRYFRRLSSDPRQAGLEMAARIRDLLDRQASGSISLSAAKRALHGDRHPKAWQEGIRRLLVHRIARVEKRTISLTWSETITLPDPYQRPEKAKRHREPTQWFEDNRRKMDGGQHSSFDEDWGDTGEDEDGLSDEGTAR